MIVFEPVQAAIWHCLNHYSFNDAIFLAERLYAEVDTDEALFLLATCYYRSGQTSMAYSTLKKKDCHTPQSRCLLAKCCVDLQKYAEAESILTGEIVVKSKDIIDKDIISEFGDEACFVFKLLAIIASKTHRIEYTAEMYKKSLKLNPFLWDSFEQLCNLGYKPDPAETFTVSKLDNFSCCQGVNPVVNYVNNNFNEHNYTIHNSSSQNNNMDPIYKSNTTPVQLMNVANSGTCAVRLFVTPEESVPMTPGSLGIATLSSLSSNKVKKSSRFRSMLSPLQIPSFGLLPFNVDLPTPGDGPAVLTPEVYDPKNKSSLVRPFSSGLKTMLYFDDEFEKGFFFDNVDAFNAIIFAKRVEMICEDIQHQKRSELTNKETPLQQVKPVFSQSGNTSNTANIVNSNQSNTVTPPLQNVRRSTRLFSSSCSVKENSKSPKHGKFVSPKSPSKKTKRGVSKTNINISTFNDINVNNEKNRNSDKSIPVEAITNEKSSIPASAQALQIQKDAAEGLMSLLRDIGTAYLYLSKFECMKAIECFNNLSPAQRNTGWVMAMIAKAYFELPDHANSVKYFRKMREIDPDRLLLTELYSTALWFLQRDVELSALSQDLVAQSRHCPQAWCATANCFSLHKEHETAIKFLHRAVQVDPSFSYAYTLLGHEYLATEELDKAMSCFRNAIRICNRDYSAYFGLGSVYSKQEKYELAQAHYFMAENINPKNVVILCHIGVVQNAQQKTDSALSWLGKALAINPKNALCKFHRANIYFNIGRHCEALKELEQLRQIVPKESLVYYLIGKIHKKLGNTHLALMHFSWAMDLDPKGTHTQIKESIDPSLSRGAAEEDIITGRDTALENDEQDETTPGEQEPPVGDLEPGLQESDESF